MKKPKSTCPPMRQSAVEQLQAAESVRRGLVDFAVVTGPVDIEKPLVSSPLVVFKDILIGGVSYASYADKRQSPGEVAKQPLVFLHEGTRTYRF